MRTLSHEELLAAYETQDWNTLWLAAMPLVKLTIKRMMQAGEVDPYWTREDLLQEGLLAAGNAVRTWITWEGKFSTWVMYNVRGRLLDYLNESNNGGVGSKKVRTPHYSLQEPRRTNLEDVFVEGDEFETTREHLLTYEEGSGYPEVGVAAEKELLRARVGQLPPEEREAMFAHLREESLRAVGARRGRSGHWAHQKLQAARDRLTKQLRGAIHAREGTT